MDRFYAEDSVSIERPPEDVFRFLSTPPVERAELTPLEEMVLGDEDITGVGAVVRTTLEFAARELHYVARCTRYDPPHRLELRFEGDLQGTQAWHLTPEGTGTRASMTLDIVEPVWTPAYLRDRITAEHWTKMLVDQTLSNVKAGVERG